MREFVWIFKRLFEAFFVIINPLLMFFFVCRSVDSSTYLVKLTCTVVQTFILRLCVSIHLYFLVFCAKQLRCHKSVSSAKTASCKLRRTMSYILSVSLRWRCTDCDVMTCTCDLSLWTGEIASIAPTGLSLRTTPHGINCISYII